MASLTLISTQAQLSLQQHLDLSSGLLSYLPEPAEGEPQPSMMAQTVPNPPNDRKRVKVYELRNNDWFDRGTGFCVATVVTVRRFFSFLGPLPVSLSAFSDWVVHFHLPFADMRTMHRPMVFVRSHAC